MIFRDWGLGTRCWGLGTRPRDQAPGTWHLYHFLIDSRIRPCQEYKKTKTWGHSDYSRALDLAFESGVKTFGLFHINQERTDLEMDRIVEDCRERIDQKGHKLECLAVSGDSTFNL